MNISDIIRSASENFRFPWDHVISEQFVAQTNAYANSMTAINWKALLFDEFKVLLGLMLYFGYLNKVFPSQSAAEVRPNNIPAPLYPTCMLFAPE